MCVLDVLRLPEDVVFDLIVANIQSRILLPILFQYETAYRWSAGYFSGILGREKEAFCGRSLSTVLI